MRVYDTTKGLADVTVENLAEFVEWWLFWRACDALHVAHFHPNYDTLLEAVKETLLHNKAPIELVPVVLAKAEHIKSLFEGDNDLYEFVTATGDVPATNSYAVRYAPDRYLASWGAQRLSDLPIIIDDERGMPSLYGSAPSDEC